MKGWIDLPHLVCAGVGGVGEADSGIRSTTRVDIGAHRQALEVVVSNFLAIQVDIARCRWWGRQCPRATSMFVAIVVDGVARRTFRFMRKRKLPVAIHQHGQLAFTHMLYIIGSGGLRLLRPRRLIQFMLLVPLKIILQLVEALGFLVWSGEQDVTRDVVQFERDTPARDRGRRLVKDTPRAAMAVCVI